MNLHRFYCERITRPMAEISDAEARHLAKVLRLEAGDKVELFDGAGTVAEATIKTTSGKKVTLQVEDLQLFEKPAQRIILAVSVAKGERFDWLIEKCTELGVNRIVPVLFERTVKQPRNPKIVERWGSIAISAAKQSRRTFLPRIDKPVLFQEAIEILEKDYPQGRFVVGSLSAGAITIIKEKFGDMDIVAFVGPEGGLTEEEEDLMRENNIQEVRLTNTILRVETAAMAFAVVLTTQRDVQ